jgi:hypothetical protein
MRGLLPLWHLAQRLFYDWALSEIDPLHPDVPEIVLARAKLPRWGERGFVSWGLVTALAALTWLAVVCIEPTPIASASADQIHRAVDASRAADREQCRRLHGRDATAIELPDGSHRCADRHGRRLALSVITIHHTRESATWNGLTSY